MQKQAPLSGDEVRPSGLDLLRINLGLWLVVTESNEILYAHNRSPGPRLLVAGHQTGNLVLIRHDVGEDTAHRIRQLASEEPVLREVTSKPIHLERYLELLVREAQIQQYQTGSLLYSFPTHFSYRHEASLVTSDSSEGRGFLEDLPQGFRVQGYGPVSEIRAPWCLALDEGQIVSIAHTVRIGPTGAEVGVDTGPSHRGRGFAAAATAGWASLPSLRPRSLFYGTDRWNKSSQRVTDRLGLHFIGASFSIR